MGKGSSGKILGDRSYFQGVANIIRFNWTFYLVSFFAVLFSLASAWLFPIGQFVSLLAGVFIALITLASLIVSFYVYDYSNLYSFEWMKQINAEEIKTIYNFSAGFDESSAVIRKHFLKSELKEIDFYREDLMSEPSIERARKKYPPSPDRKIVDPLHLSLPAKNADLVFLIFSAHELRDRSHRLQFLNQLKELIRDNGAIYLMEHLRDWPNFLAYSIGFLHFYSSREWAGLFQEAGLIIMWEKKRTPFVSVFKLVSNE